MQELTIDVSQAPHVEARTITHLIRMHKLMTFDVRVYGACLRSISGIDLRS